MTSALPQELSSCELVPEPGKSAAPFAHQTVELTKQAYIQLKWAANYWQAQ